MAEPEQMKNLVSPASLAVDAVLVAAFFAYMYTVMAKHVPSDNPEMIRIWGCYTTACLTGVFWLALQMFRITLRGQLEQRKKR